MHVPPWWCEGAPDRSPPDLRSPPALKGTFATSRLLLDTTKVVLGGGVAFKTAAACPECWALTWAALPGGGPDVGCGSLAALVVQRITLGWGPELGLICWKTDHFAEVATARCPRHAISEGNSPVITST